MAFSSSVMTNVFFVCFISGENHICAIVATYDFWRTHCADKGYVPQNFFQNGDFFFFTEDYRNH